MNDERGYYTYIQGLSFYIPGRMMGGIERYIEHRVKPGDFLTAIICNNLKMAVMTADEENIANLPAYMDYFYNHVPSNCWGSEAVLKDWLAGRE